MLKIKKSSDQAPMQESSPSSQKERRLLIVDDEAGILLLLNSLFSPFYSVRTAESGAEALALLREGFSPEVIIADQRMPEMTGAEFLGESRKLLPNAVRVTLTGYTDIKEIVASVNNGAIYRFIGKPWEDAELLETIRLCFEQYDFSTKHAELEAALERVQMLNLEKNEIMGIVSHDLKNPISAVLGMTELMKSGGGFELSPSDYQKFSGMIHQTALNMLELVKGLLDDHWLESGSMVLSLVAIDASVQAKFVVSDYQQRAMDKNITIHCEASPKAIALADERRLHQVLDNLVSNAVKYSPTGTQVFVRVKESHSSLAIGHWSGDNDRATTSDGVPKPNDQEPMTNDRFVRIEIQDQGPGLTDDDKSKLFGKFARLSAQPTGGEHSSGLGLSIVKKMVDAMNGKVWCESEYGHGATFIVELPAAQA
ncbi:MAG: hybrid sensor histidine kinase/response regulator [Candidatus Kapabacteria bacterium]|jgi:signal transduction histidine kinase|nr:hybrid sensor histidine kinase/response regulator [Candidatus Kapabacteria bacterium]